MKLYLIDSSIFIFKAWFSKNTRQSNASGLPNHAFIGFTDFVFRLLTEVAPSKLVFAFDERLKQSQRKILYPEYKANRNPTPVELRRQFKWCQQWVECLGISNVSSDSWEADDLIGTLATLHRSDDTPIVILTADKDLTQLIHEGDLWWSFYDDKKLDYRGIAKKFGVKPEQIADQLALTGDKVDNIPGVPFIGQKTAANLLRKYDNLDRLHDNIDQISKMKFRYSAQVQQSLIQHWPTVEVSRQLTQINCSVDGMQTILINRKKTIKDNLFQMMEEHAMDKNRQQKWRHYLEEYEPCPN